MSKNYVDIAEISLNSSFLIDPDDETFELNMEIKKNGLYSRFKVVLILSKNHNLS